MSLRPVQLRSVMIQSKVFMEKLGRHLQTRPRTSLPQVVLLAGTLPEVNRLVHSAAKRAL